MAQVNMSLRIDVADVRRMLYGRCKSMERNGSLASADFMPDR
uniref:Uncharacterized protein n=1 Tax=Escherichia coli TaxID=562 RepID=A0A8F1LAI9_ECOLX|nr:hypothetical protein IHCLGBEB_00021 [Escherichia coli]